MIQLSAIITPCYITVKSYRLGCSGRHARSLWGDFEVSWGRVRISRRQPMTDQPSIAGVYSLDIGTDVIETLVSARYSLSLVHFFSGGRVEVVSRTPGLSSAPA